MVSLGSSSSGAYAAPNLLKSQRFAAASSATAPSPKNNEAFANAFVEKHFVNNSDLKRGFLCGFLDKHLGSMNDPNAESVIKAASEIAKKMIVMALQEPKLEGNLPVITGDGKGLSAYVGREQHWSLPPEESPTFEALRRAISNTDSGTPVPTGWNAPRNPENVSYVFNFALNHLLKDQEVLHLDTPDEGRKGSVSSPATASTQRNITCDFKAFGK
jgi:hypothetical protein